MGTTLTFYESTIFWVVGLLSHLVIFDCLLI